MKIDNALLTKLEKLSMIKIEKRDEMIDDLNKIVEFVEILNEIDTEKVDATFNVLNSSTPLRDDTPQDNDVIKTILKNAPKSSDNYFIVPKIIDA